MNIILVMLLSLHLPISAFACAYEEEVDAFNVRALQSSMMVAALSCDQKKQYNKFIRKHQDYIVDSSEELKSYFKRKHGSGYEKELNRFITKLANEATKKSMSDDSDAYCVQTARTFQKLYYLNHGQLQNFAKQPRFAALHGMDLCLTP